MIDVLDARHTASTTSHVSVTCSPAWSVRVISMLSWPGQFAPGAPSSARDWSVAPAASSVQCPPIDSPVSKSFEVFCVPFRIVLAKTA